MSDEPDEPIAQEIDEIEAFKRFFQRHSAGVAIVTATDPSGHPVGFTATSLASLSAVPPLLTFNMARTASSWAAIEATTHVAVHVLDVRNRALAARLAGPHDRRFDAADWAFDPTYGVPVFTGVPAVVIARVVERYPVHGNVVLVAHIEDGSLGEDGVGLLYRERRFFGPGDEV
jgi:flavin reductase (DIM6/NTAB) family NADH-FMN oxidoreductase RutF